MNIPDGEVFTAPVRDSINGTISYNTPSVYQGFTFENICLTFENGKIVKATANDTERINKVFDTDEGARYVGEFAIGVNPYVLHPMKDILFDEKIMGSILSRRAIVMMKLQMEMFPLSTGIWCGSRDRSMVGERSILMMCWYAKTAICIAVPAVPES